MSSVSMLVAITVLDLFLYLLFIAVHVYLIIMTIVLNNGAV